MMKQDSSSQIMFARFRLDIEPIADYRVRVLDFPAQTAIREFKDAIRRLRGEPDHGENVIAIEESEPWRRLNTALLYLAPTLIHGFDKKAPWLFERNAVALGGILSAPLRRAGHSTHSAHTSESSNQDAETREAVALSSATDQQDIWYPSREQVCEVIAAWAKQWAETTFAEELNMQDGRGLAGTLYNAILDHPEKDWQERTIGDVWRRVDQQAALLSWKAIPSLLAMLFVARTTSTILGDEDGARQKLIWNLVHDKDTGLSVISEPVRASSKKGDGLIAYKLDFRVQTQAGDVKTPWIALYISLRRYADRPVRKKNKGAVSVYVQMGSRAHKKGWGKSRTLVQLAVLGSINKAKNEFAYKLGWRDRLPELIHEVKGRRPIHPKMMFENPSSFNRHDSFQPNADTFLITHAEGMKYDLDGKRKGHPIQNGTSLKERIDLFNAVNAALGDILTANASMEVDSHVTLSSSEIRRENIYGLWTWDDLHTRFAAKTHKAQRERQLHTKLLYDAINATTEGHPVRIWVLHQAEQKPLVIEKYLHEMLLLSNDAPLTSTIHIHYLQFADEYGSLVEPLTIAFDENTYKKADKTTQRTMTAKFKADWNYLVDQRLKRIGDFFSQHVSGEGYTFALIELPPKFNPERLRDTWLKHLLRRACVELNIRSQMIRPIDERAIDTKTYPPGKAHIGRLRNGLRDLILRQTATLFGQPSALYKYAGLDDKLAEDLCIIGLFRHRDNARGLDFPIAVRMFADGYCEIILADAETGQPNEPIPYVQGPELGRYLLNNPPKRLNFRNRKQDDALRKNRLARFASEVIIEANRNQPTLILLEADGWRQEGVLDVADGKAVYNSFVLTSGDGRKSYLPKELPNIRIMRVRDAGTLGETPQYMQVQGDLWGDYLQTGDVDHMTLVRDPQTNSTIPHAFSIGRRLLSMGTGKNKQPNDVYSFSDGADIAHKHQQAVEVALLFHQSDDDLGIWLRLPHLMRLSPAWGGGNVVLPYQIHLAKTLVKDMLDVMKPEMNRRRLLK